MKALTLTVGATWFAVAAAVAAVDSPANGALTGALLLAVAALSVTAARWAHRRGASTSVDRQVSIGVLLPVAQMLLVAALFAAVMFLSTHDAILIMLVSVFAGALGLLTARMATARLVADVEVVRRAVEAVGEGRRAGSDLPEATTELVELAGAVNAMADRLAAEEGARRALLAAISHDLRTPLTSMRLITEAIGDEILDESERAQYVDRLRLHIGALQGLIEDLFELARLEAGEIDWPRQPVDIGVLVGDTVDAMQPDARAKRVRFDCEIADDLVQVRANPEKLQRVLFNVLQNAIRHTPEASTVSVVAARANGYVEIEVADEGPGIAAADRGHVFDAFVRAGDRAARGGAGAGLGLAIARAIVEAHDGRIAALEAERGARVRFSLPVAAAPSFSS